VRWTEISRGFLFTLLFSTFLTLFCFLIKNVKFIVTDPEQRIKVFGGKNLKFIFNCERFLWTNLINNLNRFLYRRRHSPLHNHQCLLSVIGGSKVDGKTKGKEEKICIFVLYLFFLKAHQPAAL
jgi:hypothetical protein